MAKQAGNSFGSNTKFRYQRSSAPSKKTAQKAAQRAKAKKRDMAKAAEHCRPLTSIFTRVIPRLTSSNANEFSLLPMVTAGATPSFAEAPSNIEGGNRSDLENKRDQAKKDLGKKLKSKGIQAVTGQYHTRHLAVLQFMNYQERIRKGGQNESRANMALNVSHCFNRGKWFAEKLVTWERMWIEDRQIPNGKQGCFAKSKSWFNDEGVMLAAREYLSGAGESKLTVLRYCF